MKSKTPHRSVKPVLKYAALLGEIRTRIQHAQTRAILSANAHMISLYWDVGKLIAAQQHQQGWGASVIPRLSRDIHNQLPEVKGFSERNIGRMIAFFRAYPAGPAILPQPVAKLASPSATPILPQPVAKLPAAEKSHGKYLAPSSSQTSPSFAPILLPWGHNILLMEKIKDPMIRNLYIELTIHNGWSRNVLLHMIQSNAHARHAKTINNFHRQLPPDQSDLAIQAFKDPYIFDFLTLQDAFQERELETQLLRHLEKFLVELGQGFAFVGRQYRVDVSGKDFYIDLLFYHLRLRCFVVVNLKTGPFLPEYAGKMNFYLSLLDDKLRHPSDAPSIGLILCQQRNRVIAEYALRGIQKPIGISEYELTRALPKRLQSSLPTIEAIEAEFQSDSPPHRPKEKKRAKNAKPKSRRRKS